jgi:hypothetical protein
MAGRTHGSAYLTASGSVGIAGKPKMIYSATIISGATAGVLSLKDNGSSGTLYLAGTGTINQGVTFNYQEGFFFPHDCYCTVDANTTSVLVSYEEY